MVKLRGVVPVIPIPFSDEDDSIDEPSLRRVVDWIAGQKLGGLCLPAYGSEFYKLSEAERERVLAVAIEANAKRIPVVAQANHGSAKQAAKLARRYEQMGADVISFAVPRTFGVGEADVLRYCSQVCDAVSIPVLVQDFNPGGGQTIGAGFVRELRRTCDNFCYAKLEEPLLVDKLLAIRDAVGDDVGILEGWGGYYMLEAIAAGCCGIMPGAAIPDLLANVFELRVSGGKDEQAYDLFASVLPLVNFTLQNFELFLRIEKQILVRRSIFRSARVRDMTLVPSQPVQRHADWLVEQVIRVLGTYEAR